MTPYLYLRKLLEPRLERAAGKWFKQASEEIANELPSARSAALISLAARQLGAARRAALAPSEEERGGAGHVVEGWNPERWSLLEAVRSALVLSRSDVSQESGVLALEEAFKYADEGELCALYRTLALLPDPERFVWRAGEGCRTNMRTVFEAVALDTPYPARFFDDVAWNQAVVKCLFVEAPLWRMWGLDERLSPELARMALDLADERRSAGRPVQHELWLCLGTHAGKRGLEALELELRPDNTNQRGRRAAAYGLARAGGTRRLEELAAAERDPTVHAAMADALAGGTSSAVFAGLDPESTTATPPDRDEGK